MNAEPWDAHARESANAYVNAYTAAIVEKKSNIFARKYAEMMSTLDYDRGYCQLYAETFEYALSFFTDISDVIRYTEFFLFLFDDAFPLYADGENG
jgi:hypothetical protein